MAIAEMLEKPTIAEPSTAEPVESQSTVQSEQQEDFAYGWREREKILANGASVQERIPLTLNDILHPQVGDFRMHTDEHERYCIYLYNVLTGILANIAGAIVLHDTRVSWPDPDLDAHGPDIAVIFDVAEHRDWSTFDTAEEGTKPTLIIEVTSPKTRSVDLVNKHDEYEQAGIDYYIIVDIRRRKSGIARELIGYRLTDNGYEQMFPNKQGRLWMKPVGLWIGIEGTNLVCYDEDERKVKSHVEVLADLNIETSARAKAEKMAQDEASALAEAEKRIAELEAEIDRLKQQ